MFRDRKSTKPAKAPEEVFDSESVQQQFRQPGQQERLEYVGGFRPVEGIVRGIQGGQDLKGEPPDRHAECIV